MSSTFSGFPRRLDSHRGAGRVSWTRVNRRPAVSVRDKPGRMPLLQSCLNSRSDTVELAVPGASRGLASNLKRLKCYCARNLHHVELKLKGLACALLSSTFSVVD